MKRAVVFFALVLAGCPEGSTGTIDLTLTHAPGSTVLAPVERLRVTLTSPRQVVEATRGEDGFALALEVDANGEAGTLLVEGFTADDALVATGATPPFSVAAIDADLVVFVAPPLSITQAPRVDAPERSGTSAATLSYGAVLAGGALGTGEPSGALAIYNAYDHTLLPGLVMPVPRAAPILAGSATGVVHIFGGRDAAGAATGTLLDFDTTVAPSGSYVMRGEFPALARAGETAVPIGGDRFLVTGDPAAELAGTQIAARAELGALPTAAASIITPRGDTVALFAGARGILRYRADTLDMLDATPRADVAVAGLADGRFAVVDGATRDVLLVDATTGEVTAVAAALSRTRTAPRAAATSRHVVVYGAADDTADVLDAATGALVATIPTTPRTGGFALALPNDQILIGGGEAPTARLDLFTPPPPPAAARTSGTRDTAAPRRAGTAGAPTSRAPRS